MSRARLWAGTCAMLAATLLTGGCGGGGGSPDEMVRTGTIPTRTTAEGRLATEPAPLSLADVARYPEDSPRRAVAQVLFWAQWGNIPGAIDLYDRRVIRLLGRAEMAASFGWVAPSLTSALFRLRGVARSGTATFVGVDLLTRQYPPGHESFLLRRTPDGWRIVWDTLLARSLAGSVVARLAPDPRDPSFAVRRRALAATERYRAFGASIARSTTTTGS